MIITDPDRPKNANFCEGETEVKFEATQVHRAIRTEVKKGNKRPFRAYQNGNGAVLETRLSEKHEELCFTHFGIIFHNILYFIL